jgi:CHAT domain-containing protein
MITGKRMSRVVRLRRRLLLGVCGFAAWAAVLLGAAPATWGQGLGGVGRHPGGDYFAGKLAMAEGDFAEALRRFRNSAQSAIRFGTVRWIDSICHYTMIGESLYQLGETADALRSYETALRIYVAHPGWMGRVNWPAVLQVDTRAARVNIPWGRRPTFVGRFPDQMSVQFGVMYQDQIVQQGGGALIPAQFYPIDVSEVVYCTALAMRRRLELMGPICRHTPLTLELYAILQNPVVGRHHWASSWNDVLLGLAAAAAGEETQAATCLTQGVVTAGNMDHPLTGTALLELARLAAQNNQLEEAAPLFFQATIAGAEFRQIEVVEDAFRYATAFVIASPAVGIYPPAEAAALWSAREDMDRLQASTLVCAAESAAASGMAPQAAALLERARRVVRSPTMWAGPLGARWNFVSAAANYAAGDVITGDQRLKLAVSRQQAIGPWLLHITLTTDAFRRSTITPRVASGLYDHVLREPTSLDWVLDPLQSLTLLLTPVDESIANWLAIALDNRDLDKALAINDAHRRRRFFQALPYGGRRLALGFVLAGPDELLGQTSALQRQRLYVKYPQLAQQVQVARNLQRQLRLLVKDDSDEAKRARVEVTGQLDAAQTALLAGVQRLVLGHDPALPVYIPQRSADVVRQRLPDRHAVLVFIPASPYWVAVLVSRDVQEGDYVWWRVPMASVQRQLVQYLEAIGSRSATHLLDPEALDSQAWRAPARQLGKLLLEGMPEEMWEKIDQLAIVPDAGLWYVPFESLLVGPDEQTELLIDRLAVRYVPMFSTAGIKTVVANPEPNLVAVLGQLFTQEADQKENDAGPIRRPSLGELPDAVWIEQRQVLPPVALITAWDRLLVRDNLAGSGRGDWGWSPAGYLGGSLLAWLNTFGHAPSQVVLPGFHSSAENALRPRADGQECFLAACGLTVSGARTALLSRWPVGGRSTDQLVGSFLRELPYESAAVAWRRSVLLLRSSPLDSTDEPRLLELPPDAPTYRAQHPLLWAGHLLVDDGRFPSESTQEGVPPPAAEGDEEAMPLEIPEPPEMPEMAADDERAPPDAAREAPGGEPPAVPVTDPQQGEPPPLPVPPPLDPPTAEPAGP